MAESETLGSDADVRGAEGETWSDERREDRREDRQERREERQALREERREARHEERQARREERHEDRQERREERRDGDQLPGSGATGATGDLPVIDIPRIEPSNA